MTFPMLMHLLPVFLPPLHKLEGWDWLTDCTLGALSVSLILYKGTVASWLGATLIYSKRSAGVGKIKVDPVIWSAIDKIEEV